jgi:hypothetical protein
MPTAATPAEIQDPCRQPVSATSRQLPIPDPVIVEAAEHPPAVAATSDRVLLAWTDGDTRRLHVSSSLNGTDFELSPEPLGEAFQSDQEPALATDGTSFFLAWRDPTGQLALSSSTNGEDFSEPELLEGTTSKTAPALAYGDGTLLLAWVADGQLHLWPADAVSPQFDVELIQPLYREGNRPEASSAAPNLVFVDDFWYLTWAGTDRRVNIRTFTSDLGEGGKDILPGSPAPRTEGRPAIAFLNVWIVAWTTRPGGPVGLLLSKSDDQAFVNQVALRVRSGNGVNMTTFNGKILLTWAGDEQHPGGHVLLLP